MLDSERRLVAASPTQRRALSATPRRAAGSARSRPRRSPTSSSSSSVALPELSAYQELRAGFTAAVSHELRTPLARLLVLLESATLPGADVDELVEQARQEVEQARELIDDVLFLGELETGREVVSLGRTQAQPIVEEIAASFADRAEHAEVTLEVRADGRVELPLRPRMLRVVVENLLANAIRYAGPGSTCTVELTNPAERAGAHGLGRRRGRRRSRPAAPLRALLPAATGALDPRHRPRPRDREARRHVGRRRGRGNERARRRPRDHRTVPAKLNDLVTVGY